MTTARVVHVNDNVPGAVYVGRAVGQGRNAKLSRSPFANPFKIGMDPMEAMRILDGAHTDGSYTIEFCGPLTVEKAVECYERWLEQHPELIGKAKLELRGKPLACWCAHDGDTTTPCHARILIRIANVDASV